MLYLTVSARRILVVCRVVVARRVVQTKRAGLLTGAGFRLGSDFSPLTFFQLSLDARANRGRGYQPDSTVEIRFVLTGF
jgi:hypothetical protein